MLDTRLEIIPPREVDEFHLCKKEFSGCIDFGLRKKCNQLHFLWASEELLRKKCNQSSAINKLRNAKKRISRTKPERLHTTEKGIVKKDSNAIDLAVMRKRHLLNNASRRVLPAEQFIQ